MYVIFDPTRKQFWKQNQYGYCGINSDTLGHFTKEEAEEIIKDSKPGSPKDVQIALQGFCFDFLSNDPERAGKYVKIYAASMTQARNAMFEKYGDRWNFCYTIEQFKESFPPFMKCHDVIIAM